MKHPSSDEWQAELTLATQAARAAGELLAEQFRKPHQIRYKGAANLVTEMDQQAEELIRDLLSRARPDVPILGEEGGGQRASAPLRWVVDPLDGTTNYAHGYPFFAVSIALVQAQEVVVGVVYNPVLDELFAARRRGGATLNGQPIQVSQTEELGRSLLASGFPYDAWTSPRDNGAEWHRFLKRVVSLRSDGAAALDLCHVAAGRIDGYWELVLEPWDMAAGALIVEEAGGRVTQVDGAPFRLDRPSVLASNGRLHEAMVVVLAGS